MTILLSPADRGHARRSTGMRGSETTQAQDSLRQPEDDGFGDADSGHEGVGAAVVAGMDAAPVFELAEHVLDLCRWR